MNTEGLFSALRKYRVRDSSDPLENFVTEAFAWLLKRDSGFSTFFLNSLASRHSNNTDDFKNTNWFTQCNWDGKFPDMVCEVEDQISEGTFAYVFEHKVWSHLHEKQLDNYKDYASEKYNDRYKLILITAHRGQHDQNPHEPLCWEDIYIKLDKYLNLEAGKKSAIRELLFDFLSLLEDIGLAPHASFKAEEIVGYSSSFLLRMKELWRACGDAYVVELKKIITDKNSQCFDAEITTPLDHYGLIGFKIFNEMRPSLYIGALLDTAAYHVEYSNQQKGPDCSIILTFDEPFHCRYSDSAFMELKETIRTAFIDKPNGWSFFSHIDSPDSETKNHWHSLYIRKPLIEVLSFGLADSSLQEQAQRLKKALDIPINILFNRTSLLAYRESKYALESINLSSELLYRRIAAVLQESKLDVFVWSNRSQMYLCIKFTQNTNLAAGFNLQVTDDAVKFWLFFDPHADPSLIEELINKTAPDTPLFKEQNQMVAVYETLNTRSIEEIYQHCESTIRALGFTENLPQFPEMARLSNTSKK